MWRQNATCQATYVWMSRTCNRGSHTDAGSAALHGVLCWIGVSDEHLPPKLAFKSKFLVTNSTHLRHLDRQTVSHQVSYRMSKCSSKCYVYMYYDAISIRSRSHQDHVMRKAHARDCFKHIMCACVESAWYGSVWHFLRPRGCEPACEQKHVYRYSVSSNPIPQR